VIRTPVFGIRSLDLSLLGLRALADIIRHRPKLIICGHVLLGPPCRLARWLFRIPYIAMAYAYEVRAPGMRRVAGMALRGARHVITISEFSRQAVMALDVPDKQVTVIRPGPVANGSVERGMSRADLPLNGRGRVLLSVSRLAERYKGHDMVIRALPLIRAKVPDACYIIVGDGWLRPYLERIAASIGVRDAVIFAGEVSESELEAWYRRCDVFILASRESAVGGGSEGYGIVFIEANLHGKPVIGGRSGGIPDAVLDGATGLLVNPLDAADITDAVLRLLTDSSLAARLGAEGRRRAQEELSWGNYVARFDGIIKSSVTTSRGPAGT
jgi:phosphatidylinositol alpha-1,6-mannosyltransferase